MAFANIVSVSSDLGELSRIATIRNQYAQLEKQHSSVVRRYALLLYDAIATWPSGSMPRPKRAIANKRCL